MNKLIILGSGGHAKSCIDIINEDKNYDVAGLISNEYNISKEQFFQDYPLLGNDDDLEKFVKYENALVGIGQIKDPNPRINIYKKLKEIGFNLPIIISSHAIVSKRIDIGEGSIVMKQALINADVKIGYNCIINNKALIEHDVVISENCHISTGAIINGNVTIGPNTFVGSGAIIKNGISIAENSIIPAGTFINKDIEKILMSKSYLKNHKVIIIAEAGVNHDGSLSKAKKLIDAAASAGADYVKFQTYNVSKLILKSTPKAQYQKKNTRSSSSQYSMLKKLELSHEDHYNLIKYSNKKKIKFLSSAFDIESLEFLDKLNLDFIKIPSGEIDNYPYLIKVGKK